MLQSPWAYLPGRVKPITSLTGVTSAAHTYMHTHTHVHTLMHADTHIHVYTYTHTPTHNAHTYTQLHTYINTHTLIRCLNIRNSLTKYEMWKEQFLESVGSPTSKSGEKDRWGIKMGTGNAITMKVTKLWGPALIGISVKERKLTGKEFWQWGRGFTWPQPGLLGTKGQVPCCRSNPDQCCRAISLPDSSVGKEPACNVGDPGSIPGPERSTGGGISYPFQDLGLPLWLSW